jgi:hypothetical protein
VAFNFVYCPSYHGATLLSCLLNNHSQVTALGDTVPAQKFITGGTLCGCGAPIRDCEFWRALLSRVNSAGSSRDGYPLPAYPVIVNPERVNRSLALGIGVASLNVSPQLWKAFRNRAEAYCHIYSAFYRTACELQGTSCFIDGQKNLVKTLVFAGVIGQEQVKVLHLYRDPRAAFYSHVRRKRAAGAKEFARSWRRSHSRAERLGAYLGRNNYSVLKYESFCKDPLAALDQVQALFGLRREELLKPGNAFRRKHIIGNEMIADFDGVIRQDEKWRTGLSKEDQRIIIQETQPLSARLGYL